MSNEVKKLSEKASDEDKVRIEKLMELPLNDSERDASIKLIVLDSFAKLMYDDELNIVFDKSDKAKEARDAIANRLGVDSDELQMIADYKKKNNVKCTLNRNDVINKNSDLNEFIDKMSVAEMNSILNMKASGNYDDNILNNISSRIGAPVSKLEEIAIEKNKGLMNGKNNDKSVENDESKPLDENNNDNDKDKDKGKEVASSSSGSNGTNLEEKDDSLKTKVSADLTPEKKKKPSRITMAGAKLIASIKNNKGKAMLGILGLGAVAVLAITNPVMFWTLLAAAGIGKIYKDFQAGAKGR